MLSCVVHSLFLITRWRVALALTLLWFSVSAVNAQYRFDVWTTENGLPQNSVNAILQTRDGYLWFATNDGLVRYDGARFTIFNRGNTKGMESNWLSTLFEDRHGTLWIGTDADQLMRYRDGAFTTYAIKEGAPHSDMLKIEEDAEGSLWIMARNNSLRWKNEHATVYHPTEFMPTLSNDHKNGAGVSNLWWCQDAAGLHYLSHGRVVTYTARDGLPNGDIYFVSEDQYGTLWISLKGAGLVRVEDGHFTVYTVKDGLPSNNAPKVFGDRKGNIWLLLGKNSWLLLGNNQMMRLGDSQPVTAPFPWTLALYEDREGTFWIGGHLGLARMQQMAVTALTKSEGLFSELVYTIFQDHTGAVWLGSWGGGVSRYKDGKFTHYFNPDDFFSTKVTSLYEDHTGVIWIGTYGGISQCKDGKITRYSDQHGLSEVWGMYQDRAGQMWFATSNGLTRYAHGSFTTYTTQDGLANNSTTVLFEDHAGALWIGSHGGLTRYADGRFTAWTEKDGFPNSQIRAIYEDRDGVLWIGTYDSGLYRFKDGRVIRYTTQEGLFNNGVFQILEDARGNFWLSSNLGLYRVRRQELNDFAEGKIRAVTSIAYGKKDGMPTAECNGGRQPAGWQMRDGKLWFPTMLGVAIVDPAAIPLNTLPPPVVIEEVQLNHEKTDVRDGLLRIPPGKDNLEIQYTALSFINPEHVRFKYKLAGVSSEWVDVGTRRAAYYSQLPPGNYTFTVTAANSDGVWNEQGVSLKFVVLPPFWRTWWFLGLMFLSAVTTVGLSYRQHISRLKREQRQREETLQRERALKEAFSRELITSQEKERARIARELHDDLKNELTLINFAALQHLAKRETEDHWRPEWERISTKARRAIAVIMEILHGLRPQILEAGLTEALRSIVNQANQASSTSFAAEISEIDGALPKEHEIHLYRIAQECVSNIIRHAQATQARVVVHRDAAGLRLTIEDSGRGFDPAALPGRGFGLTNIAQRAHILGGTLDIHSVPNHGTTITLRLALPPKIVETSFTSSDDSPPESRIALKP